MKRPRKSVREAVVRHHIDDALDASRRAQEALKGIVVEIASTDPLRVLVNGREVELDEPYSITITPATSATNAPVTISMPAFDLRGESAERRRGSTTDTRDPDAVRAKSRARAKRARKARRKSR